MPPLASKGRLWACIRFNDATGVRKCLAAKKRLPLRCGELVGAAVCASQAVATAVLDCFELNAKNGWLPPLSICNAVCDGVRAAAVKRRAGPMVRLLRCAANHDVKIAPLNWDYISVGVLKSGFKDGLQVLLTEWGTMVPHRDLPARVAHALNWACVRTDMYSIRKLLAFAAARDLPVNMMDPLGSSIRKNHVAAIRALCAYKHADMEAVKASGICPTNEWGDSLFDSGCRHHPLEMAFSEKPAVLQTLLEMPWMQTWVQQRARACLERAVCCSGLNSNTLKMFLYHKVVPNWCPHIKPALALAMRLDRNEAVALLVPYPGVAAIINKDAKFRDRLLAFVDEVSPVPGTGARLLAALELKRTELDR